MEFDKSRVYTTFVFADDGSPLRETGGGVKQ